MLVGLAATTLGGCLASESVEPLGSFLVAGTMTEGCADSGLLAMPPDLEFTVQLRRVGKTLYWTDGANQIAGNIADDDTFVVASVMSVDMRVDTPGSSLPECIIDRQDQRSGTLQMAPTGKYSGFSGRLVYEVIPRASSDCSDLLTGAEPLAHALPCTISYDVQAQRE